MSVNIKNINNVFYIFLISHLIIWTIVPTLTNNNLPLDTIEALAWGSNLDWGFNKHPPASAFFLEVFYQIFGSQDWAYYFLSQIFIIVAFYFVFKSANEILNNNLLSLISILLLESIYFYNFTSPEFNVNVSQLPFWSLTVYYSWKIYNSKDIKFLDCFLIGLFGAIGFLSKYLFAYLLLSILILFVYLIYIKKIKKFNFKYFIIIEIFLVLLVPHIIWLYENNFITLTYGLARTGLESSDIISHIKFPLIFLFKQIGILLPFFFLSWLLTNKKRIKINLKDNKFIFLIFVNLLPIVLIFFTSLIFGSKIRTMWLTPFYLFFGVMIVYLVKSQINEKKLKTFFSSFLVLFFLSPILYSYISISQKDKRTDYPGNEIAKKVQLAWDQDFNEPIQFVVGDEWKAGNLSYHLKSRPTWEGFIDNKIFDIAKEYLCIDDICVGTYK
jgi:4-amino-4-deoxy-L-arabinose transferase-like glycosyltransferase